MSPPIRRTRPASCARFARIGLDVAMFGGGMVGLQYASLMEGAGAAAQRHRQLRFLGARTDPAIPRHRSLPGEIPGGGGRRGCRSSGLLPAALRLCLYAGPWPGGDSRGGPRPERHRRQYPRRASSTPSLARSASGATASGRVRGSSWCNIRGSPTTGWRPSRRRGTRVVLHPPEWRSGALRRAVRPGPVGDALNRAAGDL